MENEQETKPTESAEDLIDYDYFAKIKFRVAEILAAEAVPNSKKLIKLQISLGEEFGERQILAGISQFYSPETLVGRKIIVVANLKPAKLMGYESRGMLLAASNDQSGIVLLQPEKDIAAGAEVR
ncbi:MAG: methionine--tRNA ligase subunit beta [Bdellovibrionota bacterium]|jgi:methionyl-tRNA synthetase